MDFAHQYATEIEWTGNRGVGTADYRAYGRDLVVRAPGKPPIAGSSDRPFRGDVNRWNPEEMLLAAVSQCHLLSYLHVAVQNGVIVTAYTDRASGTMVQTADGGGHFVSIMLRPVVTVRHGTDEALVQSLHAEASSKCFIAASVNFPVSHEPRVVLS